MDSYLDGEGEEEEARREVQMEEVHQVHQEEELPEPQEEGGSCCSYCVLDEEGEEGSRWIRQQSFLWTNLWNPEIENRVRIHCKNFPCHFSYYLRQFLN